MKLLATPLVGGPWGAFRRWELHREYTARREFYAAIAAAKGVCYREEEVIANIRLRMKHRGYSPSRRRQGQIHTFAFFPSIGWHRDLLPDLRVLGPVTHFDYSALGFSPRDIYKGRQSGTAQRKAMNDRILPALRQAHGRRPVDWIFVYASGLEISAEVLRRIAGEFGIPIVNMCLDDKQSWEGRWLGNHRSGQVDIAPEVDLSWTSSRLACEWYLSVEGRPVYLPEGFDASKWRSAGGEQDIPVSFVGAAYGSRPRIVRYLRRNGVPIQVYGSGWRNAAWVDDPVDVVRRSLINLGIGGIGFSERITNVKGRDFEIPAVGRGVYLTSFNSDLAQHFVIGREILCYNSRDEMLELIRYYSSRPDEAREIACRGRVRCLADHRWLHRYLYICGVLGILDGACEGREGSAEGVETTCMSQS